MWVIDSAILRLRRVERLRRRRNLPQRLGRDRLIFPSAIKRLCGEVSRGAPGINGDLCHRDMPGGPILKTAHACEIYFCPDRDCGAWPWLGDLAGRHGLHAGCGVQAGQVQGGRLGQHQPGHDGSGAKGDGNEGVLKGPRW